jgi:DNA-binding NarL/FixJ family response regulator
MPEMPGKDVVEALQAIDPQVKIIITSGYSEDEVAVKIGAAKVAAFMQKPYRLKSLLSKVQSVLQ